MTLTEKILARAAGKARVQAGDNVWVNADILMTHDVCGPGTICVCKREFGKDANIWDRDKIVIIPDHYIFTTGSRIPRVTGRSTRRKASSRNNTDRTLRAFVTRRCRKRVTRGRAKFCSAPIRTRAWPELSMSL